MATLPAVLPLKHRKQLATVVFLLHVTSSHYTFPHITPSEPYALRPLLHSATKSTRWHPEPSSANQERSCKPGQGAEANCVLENRSWLLPLISFMFGLGGSHSQPASGCHPPCLDGARCLDACTMLECPVAASLVNGGRSSYPSELRLLNMIMFF